MKKEEQKKENPTGKYVIDKASGKLVKVSDRAAATKKDAPGYPSCGTGGCCCG